MDDAARSALDQVKEMSKMERLKKLREMKSQLDCSKEYYGHNKYWAKLYDFLEADYVDLEHTAYLIKSANDALNTALYSILDIYKINNFKEDIQFDEKELEMIMILLEELYSKEHVEIDLPEFNSFYGSYFQQFARLLDKMRKRQHKTRQELVVDKEGKIK